MKIHICNKRKLVYRQLEPGEVVLAGGRVLLTGEGEEFDSGDTIVELGEQLTVPEDDQLRWVVDWGLTDEWRAAQPRIRKAGSEYRLALSTEDSQMFLTLTGEPQYAADSRAEDPEGNPRKSWFPEEWRGESITDRVYYVYLRPIDRPAVDMEQQILDRLFQVATPQEAQEQISEVRRLLHANS